MRNYSGSWKHKPPIFYVIVLVAIGVAVIAIWRQYHPYDYIVWDALIVVFAVSVIVTCLYFVRDWWVDGKERNQLFQQQLQQPTPPPNIAPTKIYEHKPRVVARRPVKQLPPMNRRPFLGIGGKTKVGNGISQSSMNTSSHATSPQNGMGNIPQSEAGKSGMGNGIHDDIPSNGMGNLQQNGMGKDIPLDALSDKRKRIFDFFTQFPDATLKEAEGKLGIPNSTIDRIKKDLISKGAWS